MCRSGLLLKRCATGLSGRSGCFWTRRRAFWRSLCRRGYRARSAAAPHHPVPAPLPEAAPTQAALQALQKEAAAAERLAGEASLAAGRAAERLEQLQAQYARRAGVLLQVGETLECALTQTRTQWEERERRRMELEAQAAEHKRLEETLPQQERMWEQRRNAQQALEQEVLRLHLAAQQLERDRSALAQTLEFDSQAEAQQYTEGLRQKKERFARREEETRQAWEACPAGNWRNTKLVRVLWKHSCGKPRRRNEKRWKRSRLLCRRGKGSCGRSGSIRRHASWLIALCGMRWLARLRAGQSGAGVELGEGLVGHCERHTFRKGKDHAGNLCAVGLF